MSGKEAVAIGSSELVAGVCVGGGMERKTVKKCLPRDSVSLGNESLVDGNNQ